MQAVTKTVFDGNRGRIRFSKAPWYKAVKGSTVSVVGAGGIGSWLTHFLARAGAYVSIYDMDSYDVNNMGGQFAHARDVGRNKAKAIASLVNDLLPPETDPYVNPIPEAFEPGDPLQPVTFACVDDMNVRKDIYETWLAKEDREVFIDGRMGAEQFELYAATAENDNYMDHWFPPNESASLPCAYRATSHIGSMLASVMFGVYTNHFSEGFIPTEMSFNTQLLMMESS